MIPSEFTNFCHLTFERFRSDDKLQSSLQLTLLRKLFRRGQIEL